MSTWLPQVTPSGDQGASLTINEPSSTFLSCSLSSLPLLCFLGSPSKNLSSLQSVSLWLLLGATKLWHWVIGVISRSLQLHPLCPVWGREKVKVIHSCPVHFDSMNYTAHGILQARILEWAAFSFSRGSSQPTDRTQVSHIAGRFFTSWATREANIQKTILQNWRELLTE